MPALKKEEKDKLATRMVVLKLSRDEYRIVEKKAFEDDRTPVQYVKNFLRRNKVFDAE